MVAFCAITPSVGTLDDRSVSVLDGSSKGLSTTDQLGNAGSSGLPGGTFGGDGLLPASLTAGTSDRIPPPARGMTWRSAPTGHRMAVHS